MTADKEGKSQAMFRAVEKKRAYEGIIQQVITLIEEGKLKHGDQLPSERDLTKIFKVSRPTVRKAICTMASMKLLQSSRGIGSYVLAADEGDVIQISVASPLMQR